MIAIYFVLKLIGKDSLAIFNDWGEEPDAPYPMAEPKEVCVKNVRGAEHVLLCENPDLLGDTAFSLA